MLSKPSDLDPIQFGWSKDELNKVLMPVILPKGIEAAPASILKMIRCGCGSEEPVLQPDVNVPQDILPAVFSANVMQQSAVKIL